MAAPEASLRPDAAVGATTVTSPMRPASATPKLAAGGGTPLQLKQQQPLLSTMQKAPSGRFSNLPVPRASLTSGTILPQGAAPALSQAPTPALSTTGTSNTALTPASPTSPARAPASISAAVSASAPIPAIETIADRGYSSMPLPYSSVPDGLERVASDMPSFSTSEMPSFTGHKNITDILDSDCDDGASDDGAEEDWGHLDGAIHKLRAEEASFIHHAKIAAPQPAPKQQQQQPLQLHISPASPPSPSSPAVHPMLQFDTSPAAGATMTYDLNKQLSGSQTSLLQNGAQGLTSPTGSASSRRVSFAGGSVPSRRISGTGGSERAAAGLLLSLTQQLDDPQVQPNTYNLMSVRNASKNFQKEVIPGYARHTRASSSGEVDINRTVSGKFVSPLRSTQSRLSIAGHDLEQQLPQKTLDRPARSTMHGTKLLDVPTSPKLALAAYSKPPSGLPPPVPKHPLARNTTTSSPGTQL